MIIMHLKYDYRHSLPLPEASLSILCRQPFEMLTKIIVFTYVMQVLHYILKWKQLFLFTFQKADDDSYVWQLQSNDQPVCNQINITDLHRYLCMYFTIGEYSVKTRLALILLLISEKQLIIISLILNLRYITIYIVKVHSLASYKFCLRCRISILQGHLNHSKHFN